MKQALFLLLFFLSFFAKAQSSATNYRAVVIPYNQDYKITKPEFAVYKRLVYLPDSLLSYKNFSDPPLHGPVKDYYMDGSIYAQGTYVDDKAAGTWSFYYSNKQLNCRGTFDSSKAVGVWEFWWPNGKPLMVVEYQGREVRVLSMWSEEGEQTVTEGNGVYERFISDEQGQQVKIEGTYINGYQAGRWTYELKDGTVVLEQTFGSEGYMLEGITYEGKRRSKYKFGNRFQLQFAPEHLSSMGYHLVDLTAYDKGYPVFADLLNYEVQLVEYLGEASRNKVNKSYYRVVQRFEGTADTLNFDVPIEAAKFKGDFQSYLNKNLRLPASMLSEGVSGTVVASIVITSDGKVSHVSIIKSLHGAIDGHVKQVLEKTPNWIPAKQLGKPVSTTMIIPIHFKQNQYIRQNIDTNR